MIALGRLFHLIDIDIAHVELENMLPKSYAKENRNAIQAVMILFSTRTDIDCRMPVLECRIER